MRPRHVAAECANARAVLHSWHVSLGQKWETLSPKQRAMVEADCHKRTGNDLGPSLFYALVQRRAA